MLISPDGKPSVLGDESVVGDEYTFQDLSISKPMENRLLKEILSSNLPRCKYPKAMFLSFERC